MTIQRCWWSRALASAVAVLSLIAGSLLVAVAPASATSISPVGLTQLKFQAGSYLDINFGLPTAQHFNLGPSTSIECSDGVENNDAAPLGTVGSGGGTDALFDYYPADNSRSIATGIATGGSTTTVVDAAATWTTNQWAGDSVWITAGAGSGGKAHIASNTATTLTLTATNANAPVGYIQGLATAAAAGSEYHISTADPECASAADNSELAVGAQPKENTVIVATIAADGTTSIPKTVRTSEASALTSGGIYFPPGYIPDASEGMIVAGIQPAPTAAPATPFAGSINIDSGAVSMPLNIRVQLQGGSGITALGTSCYAPSSSDSNGIGLPLATGTTSPAAPNFPITGKPFNTHNSSFTVVANNFSVGGAGNNCALLNFGASSINTAFGLPAAAGNNTASFTMQTTPALNYNGPADAGPDQVAHNATLVTLDGSASYNVDGDPIATYAWTQTAGPPVVLTGADGPHPTFTTEATDATYAFDLTVTTAGASSSTDSVTVTSNDDAAPVVNAGPDQSGKVAGTTVSLEGSATDANLDPLTYSWTQTAGPSVTVADSTTRRPSFVVPPVSSAAGDTFTFQLTADDGFPGGTGTDSVTVTSAASTPTVTVAKARAGGGSTFYPGDLMTLSAAITNPDGTNPADYTYSWSQASGRTTTLSSTTAAAPTYTLPSSGAAPTTAACTSGSGATSPTSANCPRFQVVVTKTNTGKSSAAAALAAHSSSLPTRPVANAGTALQALAGDPVTLNGTASTQAQGHTISYAWTQTAGDPVSLSSATDASPTFTAPATPQTLTFSLIVTDTQSPITGNGTNGNTSVASTVNVVVQPNAVVANAGPDQTGKVAGTVVTLNASGSFEPHGQPLSYTWTQIAGPAATLSNAGIVNPTFTVPAVTAPAGHTLTFQVTATNGGPNPADTSTDTVDITSIASTPTVTVTRTPSGTVFTGDQITLGATITNPDGTNPADYTYVWTQASGRTTTLSSTTAANPTYTVPSSGSSPTSAACTSGTGTTSPTSANCPRFTVVVTKVNTGKASAAASLGSYASSLPTRPVANAGTAQNVKVGSGTVTLDGSASTQAQGHVISYSWSQIAGPAVTLSSTTAQKPTFTAPNTPASYTFSLTVLDTQSPITSGASINTSLASTVNVTVSNYTSPVASSGSNQSVPVGTSPVTLDASASSQADGHTLSYLWSQTAGTPVVLSSTTAVQPTFTAPNAGTAVKFTVTVTDTQNPNPAVASATSGEVTVTVTDYASPVASQGPDQSVLVGSGTVTLDASASSQADGHTLGYTWAQTGGTPVTLSDVHAVHPTFNAPIAGTNLKFTVTVTDTQNPNPALASTTSPEVTVAVGDFASPVASAGAGQTVHRRDLVTLDASGSSQADGHPLAYLWTQTGGTPVTLSDATAVHPVFFAPDATGSLMFTVTVTDTLNPNPSAASTTSGPVQIDVQDYAAPVADAGASQSNVDIGTTVTLDGSASEQIDGHALTYAWSQVAGPSVTLSSSTAQKPTFTAPTGPVTLEFQLVVDDTFNSSAPSTVFVNVNGIHGLDFATQLTGDVKGEAATSTFVAAVTNNGVLTRTIASGDLAVSITRNNVAVPSSQYSVTAKSAKVLSHQATNFTLKWNHGTTALHAGDVIVVSVCTNQLGDEFPANNCGVIHDPAGDIAVFGWTKQIGTLRSTATSTAITAYFTNMSSFTVRPIRLSENMTVSVRVNGGAPETVAAPAMAPFSLGPDLATKTLTYTWTHARLSRGDSVEVTACAVVPNNTAVPTCWAKTVTVT